MRTTSIAPVQEPSGMPHHKYRPFWVTNPLVFPQRTWPDRHVTRAPRWLSTDLRDGNQALIDPMELTRKRDLFDLLVKIGFKEIEIGFPAASQTDYDFVRSLVEEGVVSDDVCVSVLTQAREDLIERTLEALVGFKRANVHIYNATSPVFREVVFGNDRQQTIELAVNGVRAVMDAAERHLGDETVFGLEYSPEVFVDTEPEFALEICERVMDTWQVGPGREIVLNLPATVERYTPDSYADQVEWISTHLSRREYVCLSIHNHNDRGSGVGSAELAMKAGADRVEGCLLGQGERTGNVDLLTLALNLFSQGVDPCLKLGQLDEIRELVEQCTQMPTSPRHPYVGELVYTSFSGSHQDAIKKGFEHRARALKVAGGDESKVPWTVPYLPIDPQDVGRDYRAVVRVNSQSGKGGIAFMLKRDYQLDLPRNMQVEFYKIVQAEAEMSGGEVDARQLALLFAREYFPPQKATLLLEMQGMAADGAAVAVQDGEASASGPKANETVGELCTRPYELLDFNFRHDGSNDCIIGQWQLRSPETGPEPLVLSGTGDGPIAAFVNSLARAGIDLKILDYFEHAMEAGQDARAVAYVQVEHAGVVKWGVGIDRSISRAGYEAIMSALNRMSKIEVC